MYLTPKRPRLEEQEGVNTLAGGSDTAIGTPLSYRNPTENQEIYLKFNRYSRNTIMTDSSEIHMPYFGIQCDWEDQMKQVGGKSWISVRRPGEEKSIHGDLTCVRTSPLEIKGSEPFSVCESKITSRYISVKETSSDYECGFIAPVSIFNRIHTKSVVSLDVTEGGLGVSVCQNNELKVWETDTGTVRRKLIGHPVDVYTCRFFPSGVVVLSAGADLTVKVWSAENGQCPVTFRGHTAAVQDTCIVDRGRNVISISKDGTARLWDCGESKCLTTIVSCGAVINSCCLAAPSTVDMGSPAPDITEREIGTNGKLLLLAREDGKVQGVSMGSRKEIFTAPVPSAANKVIATGLNSFVVGCQGGEICTFDLRKVVPPRQIYSATKTPILDLMCHPRSPASKPSTDECNRLFWAAKSDGTVALINPNQNNDNTKMYIQLTGSDSDPIYQMKHDGNYIYTACRDGNIRKYSINHVTKLYEQ